MQSQADAVMNSFARSGEFVRRFERLDDPVLTVTDLKIMRRFCSQLVGDPAKAAFRDKNIALRKAINVELARRKKTLSDAA